MGAYIKHNKKNWVKWLQEQYSFKPKTAKDLLADYAIDAVKEIWFAHNILAANAIHNEESLLVELKFDTGWFFMKIPFTKLDQNADKEVSISEIKSLILHTLSSFR